jgi:hypothetical protein
MMILKFVGFFLDLILNQAGSGTVAAPISPFLNKLNYSKNKKCQVFFKRFFKKV